MVHIHSFNLSFIHSFLDSSLLPNVTFFQSCRNQKPSNESKQNQRGNTVKARHPNPYGVSAAGLLKWLTTGEKKTKMLQKGPGSWFWQGKSFIMPN